MRPETTLSSGSSRPPSPVATDTNAPSSASTLPLTRLANQPSSHAVSQQTDLATLRDAQSIARDRADLWRQMRSAVAAIDRATESLAGEWTADDEGARAELRQVLAQQQTTLTRLSAELGTHANELLTVDYCTNQASQEHDRFVALGLQMDEVPRSSVAMEATSSADGGVVAPLDVEPTDAALVERMMAIATRFAREEHALMVKAERAGGIARLSEEDIRAWRELKIRKESSSAWTLGFRNYGVQPGNVDRVRLERIMRVGQAFPASDEARLRDTLMQTVQDDARPLREPPPPSASKDAPATAAFDTSALAASLQRLMVADTAKRLTPASQPN